MNGRHASSDTDDFLSEGLTCILFNGLNCSRIQGPLDSLHSVFRLVAVGGRCSKESAINDMTILSIRVVGILVIMCNNEAIH
jgi:hypothetical protein